MNNIKDEFKILKELLYSGEIDQETYSVELNNLLNKSRANANFNSIYNDDIETLYKYNITRKIIILIIFITVIILLFKIFYVKKPIEFVETLSNISPPIQKATTGNTTKTIDETTVYIEYLASYEISGLVVDVQNYYEHNIKNKLSPVDIGISWGFLADNNDKMSWSSSGDRFLHTSTTGTWFKELRS